jgi:TetR/AcrR family transcriptional regulator, cholesterol catabolism regulator
MTTSQQAPPPEVLSRRDEILATAADLFWANGYAGTTMSELASSMNLRKASLYHHIDKKETLLYELSLDSLQRIEAAAAHALEGEAEPLERLRCLIEAHVVTALSDRSKHATMLTEMRALTTEQREEILRRRDAYDSLVENTISAAQLSGQLRTDISARLLRLALLNMLNWTIFWFRPDGPFSAEQVARTFTSIFIDGGTSLNGAGETGGCDPA